MAHADEIRGEHSHILCISALLFAGWEVAEPRTPEVYDLIARRPGEKHWKTIQVKTASVRPDKQNSIIIDARRSRNRRSDPYLPEEIDYMAGVHEGRVYLVPCTGQQQYWANPKTIGKWEVYDTA
jgi:hypothetical protein